MMGLLEERDGGEELCSPYSVLLQLTEKFLK